MMNGARFARAGLTGSIIGFVLLLAAIFLASCQSTAPAPAPEPAPAPSPSPTTMEVEISGFAFKPDTLTVSPGTTVTWTNLDAAPHTVTTRETGYDSERLSTGDTFSYTFEQSGTYEYYCTIHPAMTATIIVE